jgi:hypothetical protein
MKKTKRHDVTYREFKDGVLVITDGEPTSLIVSSDHRDPEEAVENVATRFGTPLECNLDRYPPKPVKGSGGGFVELRVWINEVHK